MEIDTARNLLSTLTVMIPTVMTLCLITLFAFPRTHTGWIKNTKIYEGALFNTLWLLILSAITILLNITSFMFIDRIIGIRNYPLLIQSISLSITVLITMPCYLIVYLIVAYYFVERQ